VRRIAEARIPTEWGDFTCYAYESLLDGEQHLAMVRGAVQGADDVLVRVHSECLTGDVFGSLRCDCGLQLEAAMQKVAEEELGVVVYLRGHEGRGIGIGNKLLAYGLRSAATTPSTPTSSSACPSTAGSTASARRSSSTSASPPCG
jgi:3,4-dihydroxy 2-butanone 4-phosphate synthase/GTP cyclohydrolase II